MTAVPIEDPRPLVNITIDGRPAAAVSGSTILDVCRQESIDIPTLCYLDNFAPVVVSARGTDMVRALQFATVGTLDIARGPQRVMRASHVTARLRFLLLLYRH